MDFGTIIGDSLVMVGLIATAISVRYAAKQTKEANAARQLEAFVQVLNEIGSDEVRELRRSTLLGELRGSHELTSEEVARSQRLAVRYDRIAVYVLLGLDEQLLRDFHGDDMIAIWNRVRPSVEKMRETRPNYCRNFERLIHRWIR